MVASLPGLRSTASLQFPLTEVSSGQYRESDREDLEEAFLMNKGGVVAEVSKKTGLSKAEVARVVDAAVDTIRGAVVRGERVTLADFGTFERKHRNQRIARNPRRPTIPIVVPARDLPSFSAGKEFREQVLNSH
jgi:DNA-binding protein HU-beta